jgi:hypothetical protein
MIEMSQKKTYSTWHDTYRTKEMSFQIAQNKIMNTLSINITNITNVDWDEIKLKINKLAIENNDTL